MFSAICRLLINNQFYSWALLVKLCLFNQLHHIYFLKACNKLTVHAICPIEKTLLKGGTRCIPELIPERYPEHRYSTDMRLAEVTHLTKCVFHLIRKKIAKSFYATKLPMLVNLV